MGGAAAIKCQIPISARIIDSTFSDLEKLAVEIGSKNSIIPTFMIKFFLKFVKESVNEKVKLDIFEKNPIDIVKYLSEPILFIASRKDTLIDFNHSQALIKAYGGSNKTFLEVEGDHNERRSKNIIS